MNKVIYFLFATLLSYPIKALSQNCNCHDNITYLISSVKENYPGYEDKVTRDNSVSFQQMTDSIVLASKTTSDTHCYRLMKAWLSFFKDNHLDVIFQLNESNKGFIRSAFSQEAVFSINKDSVITYYSRAKSSNSLEGIWQLAGGNYKVALIRSGPKKLLGVVLEADSVFWVPGQIKFELTAVGKNEYRVVYRTREHVNVETKITANARQTYLNLANSKWIKSYAEVTPEAVISENADLVYFKVIDSSTTLLNIPSFDLPFKKAIDSTIAANIAAITGKRFFIIDIRNNRGGSSVSFEKLLPILYTKPIKSLQGKILASRDNISLYESWIQNPTLPQKTKDDFTKLIEKMKTHVDQYVLEEEEVFYSDTLYRYPEKIAILSNEYSVSASEDLLLKAKQSSKAILFGRKTTGILDYANLIGTRKFPCDNYLFLCPTSKGTWLPEHPIDNIGISPDIEIKGNVDWIRFVSNYFKAMK